MSSLEAVALDKKSGFGSEMIRSRAFRNGCVSKGLSSFISVLVSINSLFLILIWGLVIVWLISSEITNIQEVLRIRIFICRAFLLARWTA